MEIESLNNYEVIKSIDDFMTRIDFLQPKSGSHKLGQSIVRKTVKDVEQGVPLVIICEIVNYCLLKEYNLEWVGPRFFGYSWNYLDAYPCVYMEAAQSDLQTMIEKLSDDPKLRMNYVEHVKKSCTLCLSACHRLGLIHSDPKPENFLVYELEGTNMPRITLCDFGYCSSYGLARYNDDYRAPEVWKTGKATMQADIWALGLTILKFIVADTILIAKHEITAENWTHQEEFCLDSSMVESLNEMVFLPACSSASLSPIFSNPADPNVISNDISNANVKANAISHSYAYLSPDLNYDEEKLNQYHAISIEVFTMLRFEPSERSLPYYEEINSLPIIDKISDMDKNIDSFSKLLLSRYLNKNNMNQLPAYPDPISAKIPAILAAAETISEKWHKGECAIEEISQKYMISMEQVEEGERVLIDGLQGLLYLPKLL
ncbi:MAG: serine/threonine-protein kinase [Candidatus Paceibacterota bacterium]